MAKVGGVKTNTKRRERKSVADDITGSMDLTAEHSKPLSGRVRSGAAGSQAVVSGYATSEAGTDTTMTAYNGGYYGKRENDSASDSDEDKVTKFVWTKWKKIGALVIVLLLGTSGT